MGLFCSDGFGVVILSSDVEIPGTFYIYTQAS